MSQNATQVRRASEVLHAAKNMPIPIDRANVYVEEAANLLNRLKFEKGVDTVSVMADVEWLSNRIERIVADLPLELLRIADIIRMAKSMRTPIHISRPFVDEAILYADILFNTTSADIRADTISRMEVLAQNIQSHMLNMHVVSNI